MPADARLPKPAEGSLPASGEAESDFERVDVGGIGLAWTERSPSGAEPDSGQPPLVLLHGFTGHRDDWIGVLPVLAQRRRVLALDLRGHGDSDSPAELSAYTFECLQRDVIGWLDHLEIGHCDLLGHSVGGMLAQRLVHRHRQRFRSLILMNTAASMPAALPREEFERAAGIAAARGMAGLQELAERAGRARRDPMISLWGERYWLHHRRRLRAMTPESYRGLGLEAYRAGSFVPALSGIDRRTLIMVGEQDEPFLPGSAELEAHLPRETTRCVRIAGAGHHPHQENPGPWFRALEEHLNWNGFTKGST